MNEANLLSSFLKKVMKQWIRRILVQFMIFFLSSKAALVFFSSSSLLVLKRLSLAEETASL
jgi:hypothetical protein